MSERTYNICIDNRLFHDYDIIDYFRTNKTFKGLRRCGVKSEQELVKICLKYQQLESSKINYNDDQDSEMQKIFERIKEHQLKWKHIQSEGNALFYGLSVRAKNSVHILTEDIGFNLEKFIVKAILIPCNFGIIKSTGKKTVEELIHFSEDLQKILIHLDKQVFNKIDLLIKELEIALDIDLEYDEELIESIKTRKVNLVQFFDNYVLDSNLCSERDKNLIIHLLGTEKHLDDKDFFKPIAKKHQLTIERIRQLSVKEGEIFSEKFSFLPKLFEYSYELNFNIYKNKFWEISSQTVTKNQQGRIENTPNTLGNILGYFGGDNFYSLTRTLKLKSAIGAYDQAKYRRYRNFRVPCIIHYDFLSENKMIEILNTVYSKLIGKVSQDITYEFDEFDLNDEQFKFVVHIVSHNFELQLPIRGGVLIKKNTAILSSEIVETILRQRDDLMSAEQIHVEFNRLSPKKNKPINSIRGVLQSERFIYLRGKISLYGLKEWENKRGLKTGSIKNICLEFIENNDEPAHIYAITRHVQKFRKTSLKNIRSNLKSDPLNRFIFFEANFIGVTSKKYSESLINSYDNVAPTDANTLCTFIKNHLYYDIKKVISKFSREFNLKEIQIEYIIDSRRKDGVLKVKNKRVYYAMIEEDRYISHLFRNTVKFDISGFNPYRIQLDETKVMCRLILHNETKFTSKKHFFEFSNYDTTSTDFKSLFIYQKSLKSITAFIWSSQEDISAIIDNQFYLSEEPEVCYEKLNESLYKLSFSEENINNFVLSFENIIRGSSNEQDIDLSIYDITNMNKLQAIAHIVNMTELKTGVSIDLVEAKKYYNQIQIENSIK